MKHSAPGLARRLAIVLILLSPVTALGQGAATLTGRVIARASNAPIEGARVSIPGTRLGSVTDATGAFTIRGAEPGAVTVRAQYFGFEPQEQSAQALGRGFLRGQGGRDQEGHECGEEAHRNPQAKDEGTMRQPGDKRKPPLN